MSIGKNSLTRAAKTAENLAGDKKPETKTPAAAKKNTAESAAKKTARKSSKPAAKTAAKKPAAKNANKSGSKTAASKNVEKDNRFAKIAVGDKMPDYLL